MPGPFDTAKQGFYAQSARFWNIKWNGLQIGACQSVNYSEHTGVRGFVGEIGSDHKEPDFDMRQVQGSLTRLTLNKKRVRDIFANGDASNSDIDFRQFQFTLEAVYNAQYVGLDGVTLSPPPNSTNGSGPFLETIQGVMFTDLSFNINGPYALTQESVNFIGWQVGKVGVQDAPVQQ